MRRFLAAAVLFMGCRIGGPDGDFAILEDMDAGKPIDASTMLDASRPVDASSADARVVDAARDASAPVSCEAPANLDCDPVKGEGCLPFTQCVGDNSSKTPAAGCVLGGLMLGMTCTQDAFSTNCPNQHTCVMGNCRKYCYCDADCADAGRCAAPPGDAGVFKLCQ